MRRRTKRIPIGHSSVQIKAPGVTTIEYILWSPMDWSSSNNKTYCPPQWHLSRCTSNAASSGFRFRFSRWTGLRSLAFPLFRSCEAILYVHLFSFYKSIYVREVHTHECAASEWMCTVCVSVSWFYVRVGLVYEKIKGESERRFRAIYCVCCFDDVPC